MQNTPYGGRKGRYEKCVLLVFSSFLGIKRTLYKETGQYYQKGNFSFVFFFLFTLLGTETRKCM